MTMSQDSLLRYLVYVLRHNPLELELTLGKDGFVEMETLVANLRRKPQYTDITAEAVRQAVATGQPKKQRLQVEGSRIRARYGHSAEAIVEMEYSAKEPPDSLFHGTPVENIASIRTSGLLAQTRKYVHLTDSVELARRVGFRHSQEITVIKILCQQAHQAGVKFYNPEPHIWLVEKLLPEFLQF